MAGNPQLSGDNVTDTLEPNFDLPLFLAVEGTLAEHHGVPAFVVTGP